MNAVGVVVYLKEYSDFAIPEWSVICLHISLTMRTLPYFLINICLSSSLHKTKGALGCIQGLGFVTYNTRAKILSFSFHDSSANGHYRPCVGQAKERTKVSCKHRSLDASKKV